jgi:hypothetical protein
MLKILLLNTPCNGNGDIVFCIKISNYFKEWYNCKITIATTAFKIFKMIGMTTDNNRTNLVELKGNNDTNLMCRRFRHLHFSKQIPEQDLIFVTPLNLSLDINYSDIKALVNYSTKKNTFFFSEYNDFLDKKFQLPTGIGNNRLGLLLTDPKIKGKITSLKNKYVVIYVVKSDCHVKTCCNSFIEMVCAKYSKLYEKFDIVVPGWFNNDVYITKILLNIISKYFTKVVLHYKNDTETKKDILYCENDVPIKLLNIRADILPLKNNVMLKLYKNSEEDILVTGDQSITDVLSCCYTKNIFYQIVTWKQDFAINLSKLMPNKYIKSVKTSCGSLGAIKYKKRDYKKFISKWDFRILGKKVVDDIVYNFLENN